MFIRPLLVFTVLTLLVSFVTNAKDINAKMQLPKNSIELVHGNGEPQHTIIWLHGLGASSNDFPPIVPELGLNPERAIRFIFPQAPDRPITINGGMSMPGWYDIKGVSIEDKQDAVGMSESRALVDDIIQAQIAAGIDSQNIILAGFSQGGAVTYYTGVRSELKLAGLLALSTYLPFADDTQAEQNEANRETPIFASHGTLDQVVPIDLGKASVDALQALGYDIRWQTYPMQHQVAMEQIVEIGQWINQIFDRSK